MRTQLVKFAESYAPEYLTCPHPEIKDDREALAEWKKSRVKELVNQMDPANFFLHEKDDKVSAYLVDRRFYADHALQGNVTSYYGNDIFERLHLTFWYTQPGSPIPRFKSTHKSTPIPMLALSAAAVSIFSLSACFTL